MAYIGLQPQTEFVATSTQLLSGNGVDYEYALNRAVSKAADITVYVDGTAQVPEVDYTAVSTQLLFVTQPPAGTDNIVVNYIGGALTTVTLTTTSFPQGTNVAPSFNYIDGTSTGIWFPSTSSLGITVSGNTRVTVTDTPAATSTTTGALRVVGGVGVTQNMFIGGQTTITNAAPSSSTTTGALVVTGGVGVSDSLNVGGALNVAGDFTVAGQFTTTGSDSLIINDPFLFLANANPGDALDTGFVSSYTVDSVTRYTGLFRDITDSSYKLFANLTAQPTTTVDTGNVSFAYADLGLGAANITSTTSSTTSATGALKVAGGVGVRGAIYVNSQNNPIAIGNGGSNGVGNIGASGSSFNTAFVKSTSAQYADLAERYRADDVYEPGTVLSFGGVAEVTLAVQEMCNRVAGVVSTAPAYLMNDSLDGNHAVSVALYGRVPCKVVGPVKKGDMMVVAGSGRARAEAEPRIGTVIGKALEDFDGTFGTIEVVVGRN